MSASEAQKRATANYRKKSVKQVSVSFYPSEADIWEHLSAQENKSENHPRVCGEHVAFPLTVGSRCRVFSPLRT